jgi:hypothetical protein
LKKANKTPVKANRELIDTERCQQQEGSEPQIEMNLMKSDC